MTLFQIRLSCNGINWQCYKTNYSTLEDAKTNLPIVLDVMKPFYQSPETVIYKIVEVQHKENDVLSSIGETND